VHVEDGREESQLARSRGQTTQAGEVGARSRSSRAMGVGERQPMNGIVDESALNETCSVGDPLEGRLRVLSGRHHAFGSVPRVRIRLSHAMRSSARAQTRE
jgi:hypothetical protein